MVRPLHLPKFKRCLRISTSIFVAQALACCVEIHLDISSVAGATDFSRCSGGAGFSLRSRGAIAR
jgi:hypothetical protein